MRKRFKSDVTFSRVSLENVRVVYEFLKKFCLWLVILKTDEKLEIEGAERLIILAVWPLKS